LTNGQLASEVDKGVTVMTDWTNELKTLKDEERVLEEKLHLARTMAERQRLLTLQNEVSSDFKRVKELRSKAYEVAIGNQSRIKSLNDEAEKLRLESVDITVDVWQLENNLKTKRAEMWQLEKAIADDKITG
jgi:chromosome segregation ATPase